ncbi:transposase [Salimicrobium salexigens]|uniref:transposase n=1 Tax=Salimicrobium salexigens TaxID=908941 RepID=UPI00389A8989
MCLTLKKAESSSSKTILKWKWEVLYHFTYKLTKAKLEGMNNLFKMMKQRSFR